MIRLFTAVDVPKTHRDRLMGLMGGLPKVRWQTEDQLHLTLRFIGEVDEKRAEEIRLLLSSVHFHPFTVRLNGIGTFGSRRKARMVWAGVERDAELKALYEKITNVLKRAGIPPEERKFRGHVTLARVKGDNGARLARYLENNCGFRLEPFEVTAFTLYQSHLGGTGAHYRVIEDYPAADQ